jgi:protocatechuate 3,4-dioxygenase beta subunit
MKQLLILVLIFSNLNCADIDHNRSGNDSSLNLQPGDCDNPDANIECYFLNMPESLSNILSIPHENETADELIITGTIYKSDGKTPYPDVILYAYHTDSQGYYSKKGNVTGIQKWHGYLHGWCKTDSAGNYTIKTIRPAPYPNASIPAHIHAAIKKPDDTFMHINDYMFTDDALVTESYNSSLTNYTGGSGIIELKKINDTWFGQRDIILED